VQKEGEKDRIMWEERGKDNPSKRATEKRN